MEKIIISDTNILIDLISVGMLDLLFSLPCVFSTTDFVINEIIKPEQSMLINKFVESGKLDVISFSSNEIIEIYSILSSNTNNASFTDCSVWYYAKKTNGRLLTGDNKLRKSAEKDNVKVSGILYVFDNLIEYGIIDEKKASELLESLMRKNQRLPMAECRNRILGWINN